MTNDDGITVTVYEREYKRPINVKAVSENADIEIEYCKRRRPYIYLYFNVFDDDIEIARRAIIDMKILLERAWEIAERESDKMWSKGNG